MAKQLNGFLGILSLALVACLSATPALAENRLIAFHSGKCIDVAENSYNNGGNIQQWDCYGNANQRWVLEQADDGYHRIVSQHSGKCLDVAGVSYGNGANIQQWDCGGGENQQFHLAYAGDGYYTLRARHSGKCLDVSNVSSSNGANIHQWDCVGGDNQRFTLRNSGNYTETQNPIVLVHGVSGFNKLGGLFNYFFTIPYQLERSHATVHVASVSAFNSSEERGEQLLQQIYGWGHAKVNLIGHSHGAPTARYAAAVRPDLVASVTSVHGVNKGSRVADVIRGIVPPGSGFEGSVSQLADNLGNIINILTGSWHDQNALAALTSLSKPGLVEFNNRVPTGRRYVVLLRLWRCLGHLE